MDLFAGLDGLGPASNKKVSLAEQRRLQDQNNMKTVRALEGLDLLGGVSTMAPIPKQQTSKPPQMAQQSSSEEDDLFGIFNSAPAPNPAPSKPMASRSNLGSADLKDETDSLTTSFSSRRSSSDNIRAAGHSTKLTHPSALKSTSAPRPSRAQAHSKASDRAIAQLVDMGFEPDVSKKALEAMDGSVKGAVNWIMADAQGLPLPEPRSKGLRATIGSGDFGELQAAATQISSSVLSKASVLFSKGRKEIEKAYNNYNNQYMGDPSQPAWMRDKAKHDAKGNPSGPELSGRPTHLASPGPEPELPSRPQQQTSEGPRISRAELFRQRQKARNGGYTQTSASQSSPRDSLVGTPLATPMYSPAETPSATSSVRSTKDSTPDTMPEIDLLNLSSNSPDQVALSATEKDLYATSRELGTEAFRKGNFEGAITHYSSALQVLPESHPLRALLYSNRSAAYLKAGNLRGAFDDTTKGIAIIPLRKEGEKLDEKGTSMSDIWVKLVTRNAQAAESMEKFDAALSSWQLLLDNGYASAPVLDAKRRCLKALSPEEQVKQKAANESAPRKPQRRGWGTTGAAPTSAEGKAALEKVKASHNKQADEERQKDLLRDKVSSRIEKWQRGNEKNLRALLSTLQNVLWESCDWQPVELSDLVIPKKVRIVYMKAVARTHPDKVPSTAPVEVRMVSQSVFVVIQSAWEVFRQENNL